MSSSLSRTAAEYFSDIAGVYDNNFPPNSIWNIGNRVAKILLQRHLTMRPVTVADIGCGTGKWGIPFVVEGASVDFVDPASNMLKHARQRLRDVGSTERIGFYEASVEDLKCLDSDAYQLTLCMGDPLSYAADCGAGIDELVRITAPSGLVFVGVDSRLGYLRIFRERHDYDVTTVTRFLATGDTIGLEGLPLHAFWPDELRQDFVERGAACLGVWALPTVSAYYLFDERFRERLQDDEFFNEVIRLELDNLDRAHPTGSHHLFGLFQKSTR